MRSIILLSLFLFCSAVSAASLTWTFNEVILEDGTELTGSFDYDADTDLLQNISITTQRSFFDNCTPANLDCVFFFDTPTLTYTNTSFPGQGFLGGPTPSISFGASTTMQGGNDGDYSLVIAFAEALTNAGGTITIPATSVALGGPSFEKFCVPNSLCGEANSTTRAILAGGTVSAVPIPAAVWLFGSGLGLLGWLRRRQTA